MKASLLICCTLVLALLSACVSQDLSKLKVGMTKEEVIKIMGKANGVGIDGAREYLVYELPKGSIPSRVATRDFDPLGSGTTAQAARPVTTSAYATQPSTPGYTSTGFNTKSNVIPKADYASTRIPPVRYEKYTVVLENSKVIAFGTRQQLRNFK